MKNTVDAAAFYKALTALMEVTSKSSIEVCVRSKRSLPEINAYCPQRIWTHGCP